MHDPSDRDLERLFALDSAPGPARPVDDARFAAIIAGALGGAGFPPPGGVGGAGGVGGKPMAASGAVKGVAATKLALLAGGAVTAIAAVAWLALRTPHAPPALPAAIVATTAPATESTARAAPDPASASADSVVAPAGSDVPRASEPAIDAPTSAPAHHAPAKPGSHRRPHAAHAAPRAVATAAVVVDSTTAGRAPDDLLAEANAARATHHWREADALYARVVSGPHTDLASQTALVASGTIHLEHLADPAGAARRFRAALAAAPRDTLAEDARWGLVEAARALGDATGELRALDDFLAHHGSSALAPRARARRVELGAAP